jgi:hypothetical protein
MNRSRKWRGHDVRRLDNDGCVQDARATFCLRFFRVSDVYIVRILDITLTRFPAV